MATQFTNTNLVSFNRKQLENAARQVGVANVHSNTIAPATLITAIKAK